MLMLVLLFDLIIFLASASKFLVWVGPSSCFKSTQCRGKHNWDLYIYFFFPPAEWSYLEACTNLAFLYKYLCLQFPDMDKYDTKERGFSHPISCTFLIRL